MVNAGDPLQPKILGQTDPVEAKTPIISRYSLVAPQRWHLAKSSINTNVFSVYDNKLYYIFKSYFKRTRADNQRLTLY